MSDELLATAIRDRLGNALVLRWWLDAAESMWSFRQALLGGFDSVEDYIKYGDAFVPLQIQPKLGTTFGRSVLDRVPPSLLGRQPVLRNFQQPAAPDSAALAGQGVEVRPQPLAIPFDRTFNPNDPFRSLEAGSQSQAGVAG